MVEVISLDDDTKDGRGLTMNRLIGVYFVLMMAMLFLTARPAMALEAMQGVDTQTMTVVIDAVEGMVQVRASEDAAWQRAEPGMELTQGAEFRTGPRSKVQFSIPPDQTIVLDRLGTMKVLAAIQQANTVTTELGMTYGRTLYDIEASGGLEHESTIRSPSATLAVRGTSVIYSDQPGFPATAALSRHNIAGKRKNTRSRGTFTDSDTGQAASLVTGTQVQQGDPSTAESMASATRLPDILPGGYGDHGDMGDIQDVVDDKDAQETNEGAFAGLPQPLFHTTQLIVRTIWSAPIADLDNVLRIRNSTGGIEALASSPATNNANLMQHTFTGLRHTGDHTGSPNGGQESIISTRGALVGDYSLDVLILPETGLEPVNYDIEVYDNGNLVYEAREQVVNPDAPETHNFSVGTTTNQ
jgi:hypothetical protein